MEEACEFGVRKAGVGRFLSLGLDGLRSLFCGCRRRIGVASMGSFSAIFVS